MQPSAPVTLPEDVELCLPVTSISVSELRDPLILRDERGRFSLNTNFYDRGLSLDAPIVWLSWATSAWPGWSQFVSTAG